MIVCFVIIKGQTEFKVSNENKFSFRRRVLRNHRRVHGRDSPSLAQGVDPARRLPDEARRQPPQAVPIRLPHVQRRHPGHRGHRVGRHLRSSQSKSFSS